MKQGKWEISGTSRALGFAYIRARASTPNSVSLEATHITIPAFYWIACFIAAVALALLLNVSPAFAKSASVDKPDVAKAPANEALQAPDLQAAGNVGLNVDGDPAGTGLGTQDPPAQNPVEGSLDGIGGGDPSAGGESGADPPGVQPSTDIVALLYENGLLVIRVGEEGDDDVEKSLNTSTDPPQQNGQGQSGTIDGPEGGKGADSTTNGGSGVGSGLLSGFAGSSTNGASGATGSSGSPLGDTEESGGGVESDQEGGDAVGAITGSGKSRLKAIYRLGDGKVDAETHAPWYAIGDQIRRVSFKLNSSGKSVCPSTMAYWFNHLTELRVVDFDGLDTSCVVDMQWLFSDCRLLKKLDVSTFNTSGVTNMARMFAGCSSVEKLDLGKFDTSSVESMSGMFSGSTSLKSLNVSSFNTAKVTNMSGMFSNCSSITTLNLKSFKTPLLTSCEDMFKGCASLAALDVSGFTAEQLGAASIPTDHAFWQMNVPAEFNLQEHGVQMRDPTPEERKDAGLDDPDQGDPDKPDNPVNPDKPKEDPTDPEKDPVNPVNPEKNADSGKGVDNPTTPSITPASNAGSDVWQMLDELYEDESSSRGLAFTPSASPLFDLLSGLAAAMASPIASASLDPGLDFEEVAAASTSILHALGIGMAVDKTMAMVIAALGMIFAAGLVLTLCFKIR